MKTFETENATGKNSTGAHPNSPLKFLTATSIIGDHVHNSKDEHLGSVKDIMIDIRSGQIEYVVLELGGFLGLGEKFFAIPFSQLGVNAKSQTFVLHHDKATLQAAPGFDKEHWPETNTHMFDHASSYWGGFMGVNTGASY